MNLLNHDQLELSWVVANSSMNRERRFSGTNSYEKDLRFKISDFIEEKENTYWLDLCCGSGKALIEAAQLYPDRLFVQGVDLIDWFDPHPKANNLELLQASLHFWQPEEKFDLITCIHGLHYIGDKLGLLEKIGSWLKPEGLFIGHLDLANICHQHTKNFSIQLKKNLREMGCNYNSKTKILAFPGTADIQFPYHYIGADDTAGPNYTGQDAVTSLYQS